MHVVNGCDHWVWSMAVSIGGVFTGKLHHEVSLFISLVCVVFCIIIPIFGEKSFVLVSVLFCNLCKKNCTV